MAKVIVKIKVARFFMAHAVYAHYRFVRSNYCIGDQFIEPHGFSGSLPLFCHYNCVVLLRKINWWWRWYREVANWLSPLVTDSLPGKWRNGFWP